MKRNQITLQDLLKIILESLSIEQIQLIYFLKGLWLGKKSRNFENLGSNH